MITRTLDRRLGRLEEHKTLNNAGVLKILVTRVEGPDKTIELVLDESNDRRRGYWQGDRECAK